jgi:ABC-type Fe3+ transport system permease subunit
VRLNIAGTYFGAERELAKGWLDNFSSREQSRTARSAKNAAWIAAIAAIIAAISAVVAMYPILHEWWKATTH